MAGGSNNIARMSPRQRMINIMYIVLTAMLALNVSGDVLNGFDRVRDGLEQTAEHLSTRNEERYGILSAIYAANPQKAEASFSAGTSLHREAVSLNVLIDSIKMAVARKADGKDGHFRHLKDRENLDAAAEVLLSPTDMKGRKLRRRIEAYRTNILQVLPPGARREAIAGLLATPKRNTKEMGRALEWEQYSFDNMPAAAAITLLTKLQADINEAEAEALTTLINEVDADDVRVNELKAFVIPRSEIVMQGSTYTADVVVAALDTTNRPEIFIGGKLINPEGKLQIPASSVGRHTINGYIDIPSANGNETLRREFTTDYTVIEPMATISATMMNMLYAGIDNPLSISVPGVATQDVEATITNGTLRRVGKGWIARPAKIGAEAEITVYSTANGNRARVASTKFRVRKLPDPSPYIDIKTGKENFRYKGAPRRISKAAIIGAQSLSAAADDDFLNVAYTVESFTLLFFDSMGNAMPEVSAGNKFSTRQKEQIRRLKPGKRFFITSVKAKGPDGIVRDIAPMEVIIK